METKPFRIGDALFGGGAPLTFILGPCVIESEKFTWAMAQRIAEICHETEVNFVFKSSYDKANRTSGDSFRSCMPAQEGCELLYTIGQQLKVPVSTDVHTVQEAEMAGKFIDVIQIPAFLCRQTDLIVAAAKTGRIINVKKGQFLAPTDVVPIAKKLQAAGCEQFCFTERGVSFGYQNLVVDMRSLYWMRKAGVFTIFDATHSVQRPNAEGGRTGGDGELVPVLARAAVAAGCDGVFMEVHEAPERAFSDGPNQVPLHQLKKIILDLKKIHEVQ